MILDMNSTSEPTTDDTAVLYDPTVLTINVTQAARIIGVASATAHRAYNATGELIPGVPVIRCGRRCIVSTAALRTALGITLPATL